MAHILVIEDDKQMRGMLRQMLERAGHEVSEANNGRQGLRRFNSGKIDLIITDIIMPEKEGLETIRELKRKNGNVKIIAISGGGQLATLDVLSVAKTFGASRVLAKPFKRRDILETVQEVLQG